MKLYPAGATTNSDFGVTDYERIMPALLKMEELGILLLVHGESTDQSVDIFDREPDFYEKVMPMMLGKTFRGTEIYMIIYIYVYNIVIHRFEVFTFVTFSHINVASMFPVLRGFVL